MCPASTWRAGYVGQAMHRRLFTAGTCVNYSSLTVVKSPFLSLNVLFVKGILKRLEKSWKITQTTGKLREFEINII